MGHDRMMGFFISKAIPDLKGSVKRLNGCLSLATPRPAFPSFQNTQSPDRSERELKAKSYARVGGSLCLSWCVRTLAL